MVLAEKDDAETLGSFFEDGSWRTEDKAGAPMSKVLVDDLKAGSSWDWPVEIHAVA